MDDNGEINIVPVTATFINSIAQLPPHKSAEEIVVKDSRNHETQRSVRFYKSLSIANAQKLTDVYSCLL